MEYYRIIFSKMKNGIFKYFLINLIVKLSAYTLCCLIPYYTMLYIRLYIIHKIVYKIYYLIYIYFLFKFRKSEQGYKFCIENLKSHIEKDPENKDAVLLQGMTFDWYAQMLLSQSRHTEAFNYFLQAYNICKKINGEEHEQTIVLLNDLGTVSYMQGEFDEAVKYLSAATKIGTNVMTLLIY